MLDKKIDLLKSYRAAIQELFGDILVKAIKDVPSNDPKSQEDVQLNVGSPTPKAAGVGNTRESFAPVAVPKGEAGETLRLQPKPDQLTSVDPSEIQHLKPKQDPSYDRVLASRKSIPQSAKEKTSTPTVAPPKGHLHDYGIFHSLNGDEQSQLMKLPEFERVKLTSILDHHIKGGMTPEDVQKKGIELVRGKLDKMQQFKANKDFQKEQKSPKKELPLVQDAGDSAIYTDLSHVPLDKIMQMKDALSVLHRGKKVKFYHKDFNADGTYSRKSTSDLLHQWLSDKALPKEVTESPAFKALSAQTIASLPKLDHGQEKPQVSIPTADKPLPPAGSSGPQVVRQSAEERKKNKQ